MNDCGIVGLGMMSCLGTSVPEHLKALASGRSGLGAPRSFDASGFRPTHVGEVSREALRRVVVERQLEALNVRHIKCLLAVAAVSEAWREATSTAPASTEASRIAVVIGTGLTFASEPLSPICAAWGSSTRSDLRLQQLAALAIGDGALESVAELCGSEGIRMELNSACAASGHAVGIGLMLIRSELADLAVVAGTDAMINPLGIAGFHRLGVTCTRSVPPERACKPFDRRRDGTVIGEGAAAMVLESTRHALKRRCPLLGFVEGAGFSVDGFSVTAPHPCGAGAARAMRAALSSADRSPAEIDYLNAHGTGTRLNDVAELDAIRGVFGSAPRLAISATKPASGHLVAAAGVFEAAVTLLVLRSGIIFPTCNFEKPDSAAQGLDIVGPAPRLTDAQCAMSNSFGLGGQTSSIVLSRRERSCSTGAN